MSSVWCVFNPDGTLRGVFKKERNALNSIPAKARVSKREVKFGHWIVGKLNQYTMRLYSVSDYKEL